MPIHHVLDGRKGARQGSRHFQLAASDCQARNRRHLPIRPARGGEGQDRRLQRPPLHFLPREIAVLSLTTAASHHRIHWGAGRFARCGTRGSRFRMATAFGICRADVCGALQTMEQLMPKRIYPWSVSGSGGLGRRREALIGMLLNDFLGQRFNDWRYVLLWRLKPLHPPSIT